MSSAKSTIRIIAGQYRSRIISVPSATDLRPTGNRIRETLFNWINHFWAGNFADKNVLDLFAGSGALGFEAASRGALFVQMVESNAKVVQHLRQTRDQLQADQVRINAGSAKHFVERAVANSSTKFDLILLDPPFNQPELYQATLSQLPSILQPNALVYVESSNAMNPPNDFRVLKSDQTGAVHFNLWCFHSRI